MLAKNSKEYVTPTAEQLDINSQLVEDVINFYYSSLRKALTDLKCHNIQVENLGTFRTKVKELPKLVCKYEKHLSVLNKKTFNQMIIKKDIEGKLDKVLKLQKLIQEDRDRKIKFLKRKDEYIRKNIQS